MKRLLVIPLLFLILFSGIRINIASHYCMGSFTGSKVSFTGKLLSCGMESLTEAMVPNGSLTSHCCNNVISTLSLSAKFIPSLYHNLPDRGPKILHSVYVPVNLLNTQEIISYNIYGTCRPPGSFSPASVEQQLICIFRI